jgi:hypothetical protein
MKKALFALLAAMLLAGCPTDDNTETPEDAKHKQETRTFWRAVKIGEIDEPVLGEVDAYDDDYNYIGTVLKVSCTNSSSSYSNSESAQKANWIIRNRNKYGDDIYIGQEQPDDTSGPSYPMVSSNSWDVAWEIKSFIPAGSEAYRWPYDPALDPMPFSAEEEDFLPTQYRWRWYYTVITANIYRWTEVTE